MQGLFPVEQIEDEMGADGTLSSMYEFVEVSHDMRKVRVTLLASAFQVRSIEGQSKGGVRPVARAHFPIFGGGPERAGRFRWRPDLRGRALRCPSSR